MPTIRINPQDYTNLDKLGQKLPNNNKWRKDFSEVLKADIEVLKAKENARQTRRNIAQRKASEEAKSQYKNRPLQDSWDWTSRYFIPTNWGALDITLNKWGRFTVTNLSRGIELNGEMYYPSKEYYWAPQNTNQIWTMLDDIEKHKDDKNYKTNLLPFYSDEDLQKYYRVHIPILNE